MPGFSVKKPLTIFVAVLAIVVLGVVAYLKMTPDLLPNMDFPYVIVVTVDAGASPESVEAEVTKPMESSMATLDRIKSITSSSQDSVSMVVLEFEDGVDMDSVGVDIQQKISALQGTWGDGISAPYMLKINPSVLPVMVAAVSYDGKDVYAISDFADDTLEAKLTGITGVAGVSISGTVARQVHVILDQEKMAAVSGTMIAAVETQLDKAEKQLNDAKKQLTDAQAELVNGKKEIAGGLADGVVGSLQNGMQALKDAEDATDSALAEAAALRAEITVLQQQRADNTAEIALQQAIADDTTASATDRAAAAAEVTRLQGENALLDAQLAQKGQQLLALSGVGAATGTSLSDIQQMIQDRQELEAKLTDPEEVAKLKEDVANGTLSAVDALTLLTETDMQLQTAMTQVKSALSTLADQREQLTEMLDVGGMMNISTISQLLTAQDFSMPAGYINDDAGVSYMVSVGNTIATREELEQLVLFDPGIDGVEPVCLGDVATVFYTDDGDEIYTKLNGDDGVMVSFTKQSTFATAEVSDNIYAEFDQLEQTYDGLHFTALMDQGDYIHMIVETILSSLLWGALFSVIVLFLFLRDWRPTVITLVSIPVSVIFAVVLMYFSGVTINMISLSGLAVAVGMLVDNSVVVIENIYRLRARGATAVQAAVSGAGQVLGAITSSTLTTVCVFLPIVFVEGLTKQLFTDLALTMAYSLLASLLVALTLVPAMGCGLLRREMVQKPGILDKVYPAYRKAVEWSLGHKAAVLLFAVAALILSAWGALSRGYAFMPDMDMNNVSVTITMPEDCDRATAERLADEVGRRIETIDEVETVGSTMSSGSMLSFSSSEGYDVTAYVTLPEGTSGIAVGKQIEALCADMDCEVTAANAMSGTMSFATGDGISLNVYGEDMEDMQKAATAVAQRIAQVEGTTDVSDGLETASQALRVTVDRQKAMSHGMTVAQIYMQVSMALTNSAAGSTMTLDDQQMDMVIEKDALDKLTRETLLHMEITPGTSMSSALGAGSSAGQDMSALSAMTGDTGGGATDDQAADATFLLGDVASIEETVSLGTISRDEQRRYVNVTAGVDDTHNITLVSSQVEAAVKSLELPEGVTLSFAGENEQIIEAMTQLLQMLLLGVLLVYFIMVAQFQSLREPLIVMFTIPLAFTGGFLALLLSDVEVSVVSLIGFVMLVGIIVNNGIVLVDYINQQRMAGVDRRTAIVEAGVTRLRPILMTSLTTVMGLIVMALGQSVGTTLMRPVALVCIGGLVYATLMTLFVVPCMYDMIARKTIRTVDESELELVED